MGRLLTTRNAPENMEPAITGMLVIATISCALRMGEYIGTEQAQGPANLAQARYHAVSAHLWLEAFARDDAGPRAPASSAATSMTGDTH